MVNPVEKILIKAFEETASLLRGSQKHALRQDELYIGNAAHLYHPKHQEPLYLSVSDRLQHIYTLGASGSGKSTLLFYLIIQDILAGRGFCLIDPHGDLYQQVLSFIAGPYLQGKTPAERQQTAQKLVLIDPACSEWITAFNPLEAVGVDPYAQSLDFVGFLKKIWADAHWGPRMAELIFNTLVTLSINRLTLLEVKKLLTDPAFRERLVANLPEGETKEYWHYRYRTLSERMQANYREPILNRLSVFLSNPTIRLMVGMKESINFREIMDQGNWLLVNLNKGNLKANAHLLGSFIIAKLQLSALSRVDVPPEKRTPFFLFVDEFQNFVGEDFETIVAELRKQGLALTIAHQNLDQIDRTLRSAILGNTLTQIIFRTSNQDAATLAAELGQSDKSMIQRKLVNLKQRRAFFKKKGEPARLMTTPYVTPSKVSQKDVQEFITRSMSFHARPREEVEQEISNRIFHLKKPEGSPWKQSLEKDFDDETFAPDKKYEEFEEW